MAVSENNMQCPLCEQMVSPDVKEVIVIKGRPENRVIHVTCAERIEVALNKWRMENGFTITFEKRLEGQGQEKAG